MCVKEIERDILHTQDERERVRKEERKRKGERRILYVRGEREEKNVIEQERKIR